jgi:hypothetical protein
MIDRESLVLGGGQPVGTGLGRWPTEPSPNLLAIEREGNLD